MRLFNDYRKTTNGLRLLEMSEAELRELCKDYFIKEKGKGDLQPIKNFFSKLVQNEQMIDLTPELKKYIPDLAKLENGAFCPLMNDTINGLSPVDYVPDLNISLNINGIQEPKMGQTARAPRRGNKGLSARTQTSHLSPRLQGFEKTRGISELPYLKITLPKSARPAPNIPALLTSRSIKKNTSCLTYRQPLPQLTHTEADVLSALYTASNTKFFVGKRLSEESLDWHIIPPTYPEHMIGQEFSVMSTGGVVTIKNGTNAVVQDLYKFVEDKENEFIIENSMIRSYVSYRSFYTWREKFRERQFAKIIKTYDDHNAISLPNFQPVLDKIRTDVLAAAEVAAVFPTEFDLSNEEVDFEDLKSQASASILEVDHRIGALKDQVGQQIAEVFRIIRAANVLIQLGFEELNSLNQLPPSLKQYASDLRWRVPSLWRERMRETQLKLERKLAADRQAYLGSFFSRVRVSYNGLLIMRCKDMMMQYLDRFLLHPQNRRRQHRIHALYHRESGIVMTPTKEEFSSWVERTLGSIKTAFFQNLDTIWHEMIVEADPNYEYTIENPFIVLARFKDLTKTTQNAYQCIDSAYTYFTGELKPHADFLKKVSDLLDESAAFSDLRDIDKLQSLIHNLLTAKEELEKRPRNVFHRVPGTPDAVDDFIVDLRPACDSVKELYDSGMGALKLRVLNELNLLFLEIQDRWAAVKEQKIGRADALSLETRTAQYSLLCDVFCGGWPDSRAEVKASFDTVMRMYRQLAEKCRYTHASAARHFNKVADTLGLASVPISEEEEEEEEEEYEYEEEEDA